MHKNIISIDNISFSYDKNLIYNKFSLDINENEITILMGENGCGKTTLLKLICNLIDCKKGCIKLNNKNINKYSNKTFARQVAYVPQVLNLNSNFLVKDYLAFGRAPYKKFGESSNLSDYKIVEKYAIEYGISHLLEEKFNELSGGQKQIVAITRAMVQETPIIIMDEPMSAIDFGKQAELLMLFNKLKAANKTIILTSHNPNHALNIDCNVCLLDKGDIVANGNAKEVLTQVNLNKVYGEYIKLDNNSNSIVFSLKEELNE